LARANLTLRKANFSGAVLPNKQTAQVTAKIKEARLSSPVQDHQMDWNLPVYIHLIGLQDPILQRNEQLIFTGW
jgi:hypothetical protein